MHPTLSHALRLERMEDRDCPAAMVDFSDGVLSVTGDNARDRVAVVVNGDTVRVQVGSTTRTFQSVTQVAIDLAGGDDNLRLELAGSPNGLPISLDTGAGNDRLTMQLTNLRGSVVLDGFFGDGNDGASLTGVAAAGADLALMLDFGAGNDVMTTNRFVFVPNPTVPGDVILLTRPGNVVVSQNAALSVVANMDDGNDSALFGFRGPLAGAVDLGINLGAGNDRAFLTTGSLTATADVMFMIDGGDGVDRIPLAFNGSIAAGATLTGDVMLGDGNDNVSATYFGAISPDANLTLAIDGGDGRDTASLVLRSGSQLIDLTLTSLERVLRF